MQGITLEHTSSKKVFVAVSGKLLGPLLQNGFAEGQPGGTRVKLSSNAGSSAGRAYNPSADARNLMQHILFNSSHLAGLSTAAAAATAASRPSAPRRNAGTKPEAASSEAAASASKDPPAQPVETPGGVEQPYQRLLFESLLTEVRAASTACNDNVTVTVQTMQRGLPWMLKSFCAGVRAHHRHQAAGASFALQASYCRLCPSLHKSSLNKTCRSCCRGHRGSSTERDTSANFWPETANRR